VPATEPPPSIPLIESLAAALRGWLAAAEKAHRSIAAVIAHAADHVDQALSRGTRCVAAAGEATRECQLATRSAESDRSRVGQVLERAEAAVRAADALYSSALAAERKWQAMLCEAQTSVAASAQPPAHEEPRTQPEPPTQAEIEDALAARVQCEAKLDVAREAVRSAAHAVKSAAAAREAVRAALGVADRAYAGAIEAARAAALARETAALVSQHAQQARGLWNYMGESLRMAEKAGVAAGERARSGSAAATGAAGNLRRGSSTG
jgi:hypothetical protein